MVAVHTLIAEVLANLIDTLETTNDEALQIKLGSNTHVHILVECVEVGDEWAGRSTTGNALQGRSLYLCIASVVEYVAQSAQYGCTLQEGILHAIVYDEVNIALTVTQLRIVELVVSYTILVLHDWEWLQALGEQATHHTASDNYLAWLVLVLELSLDISAECIGWKLCCWIWIDAHLAQCLKTLSANDLLFA